MRQQLVIAAAGCLALAALTEALHGQQKPAD